jgi:flagellar basal-body rod modification protein FlgD
MEWYRFARTRRACSVRRLRSERRCPRNWLVKALADAQQTRASASARDAESTQASSAPNRTPQSDLDKDMFLQLLVLQMQNQDPLQPVENTEMIAQLAQFSALEAMTNLQDEFAVMSGNIDQLNFISAGQLLGRTVVGVDLEGEIRRGVVEGVHLNGSTVVLTVDGGLMSMAGITRIEQTYVPSPPTETSGGEEESS